MRFSPRIRDLGAARLYRLRDDFERYPNLEGRLTGQVDLSVLQEGWDELLRVAGSLNLMTSTVVAKEHPLHAGDRSSDGP
jgi:TnpA family transposase